MGDGERVVGADLEQHVPAGPAGLQPVDAERGQLGHRGGPPVVEPGGGVEPGSEAERDGQPGRQDAQFRLGVGQRGAALGEPGRVVGEQPQHPPERRPVGAGAQRERDERRVRLRFGGDPGLPDAVERLDRAADLGHRDGVAGAYPGRAGTDGGEGAGAGQRAPGGHRASGEQAAPAHPPAGHDAGLGPWPGA